MQTGWITWKADGRQSYFDPTTGAAATGLSYIDGKKYVFGKDGRLL